MNPLQDDNLRDNKKKTGCGMAVPFEDKIKPFVSFSYILVKANYYVAYVGVLTRHQVFVDLL